MHRPTRAALPLFLAAALAALSPLPSPGQAPGRAAASAAQEEPPVIGETIDVRVVNLEVVVVDGEGHRVSGLAPADFRLKVDGKAVPIGYFTEVAEGRAVAEGAGAAPAPAGGTAPGEPVGTSYLVFVDESLSTVTGERNLVLQGLIDQLSRLRPEDRMAVVAYAGVRPELLSSWSQSPADLRQVLERAKERPGRGLGARADVANLRAAGALGELPQEIPGLRGRALPDPLDLVEKAPDDACLVVRQTERRLENVASALTATLRSLSGVPGRKVALVVSGGWPRSAREYVLGTGSTRWPSGCKLRGPALWNPVHEVANQVGYTLYPVLAPDLSQAVRAEGQDYRTPVNPQAVASQLQETLDLLARQTGGEAFAGGARGSLLARVADDVRSYYWLGFTPTWKGDDRGHQVEVEVARPGLAVRTRRGFQDLSRRSEISSMVESALLFGRAPGALPLGVRLGPVPALAGRKQTVRVPLQLTIPMDHVTMVRRGRQYVAELELRVALLDAEGNRNEMPVIPVKLNGPRPPRPGEHAVYEAELEILPAPQEAVFALFDPPSGKLMEARGSIVPGR